MSSSRMKALGLMMYACLVTFAQQTASKTDPLSTGQAYLLGTGDQIVVHAANAEELSDKPFRVDADGNVNFPLLGQMHPSGKSVEEFQQEVKASLGRYVRDASVTITVSQFRTEPVTFSGSFRTPGVYNLQGRHTLTEMLSIAGGLDTTASRTLRISRLKENGDFGISSQRLLANGTVYVVDLDISASGLERNPADDFVLKPFDVVTANPADPLYVTGEVAKIGPVFLGDHKTVTMTQALALAGGLTHEASKHIKVFRPIPDSKEKQEINVDLEDILRGRCDDLKLEPRDLIVVPRDNGRALAIRLAGLASGLAVSVFAGMALAHP